jgi:choice-of-anchor B domain-containing protein
VYLSLAGATSGVEAGAEVGQGSGGRSRRRGGGQMTGGSNRSARIVASGVAVAVCALRVGGASAATIELVSQLDPNTAADAYGDVWAEGDYAYLGSFESTGVAIIDISDPENPVWLTAYSPLSGKFKDVKVYDGIGYFATDNGDGMHIVDLSTPATPTLLAKIKAVDFGFNRVHNSSKSGTFLYLADSRTSTVKVFDVSSPASPVFVRNILTPDTSVIHDVTALGTHLYASGFGGFTYVYDVSAVGGSAPPLLGSIPSGLNSHSSWVSSDGAILVSAREIEDGDVRIFDISDPGAPVLLSTIDRTSLGIDAHSPHNPVLFSDSLLFVSWYNAGVVAIDISDPSDPIKVGVYDTFPGPVTDYDGNWGVYPFLGLERVLLSDLQGGLLIVDATGTALALPALSGPGLALLGIALAIAGSAWVGLGGRRAR